ncbi:MAG: sigma 54-interacting transcriptional regulator [Firmicutes bacterium]|nr:sigma 54-interacting transcriptional regulator [Bacillota bacterium]
MGKVMESLIEIIGIKEQNCTNCHQCIAVCPVKICSNGSGNVVKFDNNLCIGCGRCIEACIKSHGGNTEKSARFAIDDTDRFLADLPRREIIALVAPSAHSSFDLGRFITALKRLGVTRVYDVSLGAEITVACYHQAIVEGSAKTPMITTPCPAVVKYIELNHPGLIEHLAPVGSPVHNLAVYVKSLHPEADLALISPCLAKSWEIRDGGLIKYNVIFKSMQTILRQHDIDLKQLEDGQFDDPVPAGIATKFSFPGGLKEAYLHHYPDTPASSIARVGGPVVFSNYLAKLERAIIQGSGYLPLMVEVLSCDWGCNMGVGAVNRSIAEIDYAMSTRAERETSDKKANRRLQGFLADTLRQLNFEYRSYKDRSSQNQLQIPTEKQLQAIYTEMHKSEEKDFRNCAACGYSSCYHMAVAVFNGLNKVQNCHLYQEKQLRVEQQALMNVNEELTTVFEAMSDGVLLVNQEARVSQFNPAAQQIISYPEHALIGAHVIDLFSGKAPRTMKLLQTGESFYDQEILLDSGRGKIHATATGIPIYNSSKEVTGATIILRPIAQVQRLVNIFSGAQASFTFKSIIGDNRQLKKSVKLAMMAATNNSTVLLQAESGTGKEVFAQAIHNGSQRSSGPFVAINCAALPRELVGSELFGYVEGAFTGARRGGRPGKFELANNGTLLLDEIGDMPLEQQAVLLRAIQEKAIIRVGGDTPIGVDVRIIAATNQDLLKMVEQGRFRPDLYYRLNVVRIWLPSLRERREDIGILFKYFLNEMSPRFNKRVKRVDPRVIKRLENYDWPGNIRELQNVVERILLVLEDEQITLDYLPREILNAAVDQPRDSWAWLPDTETGAPEPAPDRSARKKLAREQEKERIMRALDLHGGNVTRTSAELGISRNTLYRKMKQLEIVN